MTIKRSLYIALALLLPLSALAQTAPRPDAGQTLRQQLPPSDLPKAGKTVEIQPEAKNKVAPGGTKLSIKRVTFSGNTIFSEAELSAAANVQGDKFDLAQLRAIADKITDFYRENGYPFARAYLAPQNMTKGVVTITVVEGRYGKVSIKTDSASRSERAQGYVSDLRSGDVIERSSLERDTLLLNDIPGYDISPVMRPGSKVGTGDLDIALTRNQPFSGAISLNNYGNRFTGYLQLRGDLAWNSPFMLGDQLSGSFQQTEQNLQTGSLAYSLPIGHDGLRANTSYAHTGYELGREFSNLNAHGTADIVSAGLSYPLIRAARSNLYLSGTYSHKWLQDQQDSTNTGESKRSDIFVTALGFDVSSLAGVFYGNVGWTYGNLAVGNVAGDINNTRGDFHHFNADIARLQTLTQNLSMLVRFSGQWAEKNLDSSEGVSLGGVYGVRAYPTGEATGDESLLGQFELRYRIDAFTPYVFADVGRVRVDANPLPTATNNERNLSGTGFGTRFQYGHWNADGLVAFRLDGGAPTADGTRNPCPRFWLGMGYGF